MITLIQKAIEATGIPSPPIDPEARRIIWLLFILAVLSIMAGHSAFADAHIPGSDESSKMESVGTLLRFIDTGLFKWAARLLAGLSIMSAAWSLKEMRFGAAVISIVSAIIFGTAPTWVKNIFSIGGSDSVFSQMQYPSDKNVERDRYDA